jgi:hypothetical protein
MTVVITLMASDNAKNRRRMRRASEREQESDKEREERRDYYLSNKGCVKAAKAVKAVDISGPIISRQNRANPDASPPRKTNSDRYTRLTCRARQKVKLGEKPLIKY